MCVVGETGLIAQNFLLGTVTYAVLLMAMLRKLCKFFKFISRHDCPFSIKSSIFFLIGFLHGTLY